MIVKKIEDLIIANIRITIAAVEVSVKESENMTRSESAATVMMTMKAAFRETTGNGATMIEKEMFATPVKFVMSVVETIIIMTMIAVVTVIVVCTAMIHAGRIIIPRGMAGDENTIVQGKMKDMAAPVAT